MKHRYSIHRILKAGKFSALFFFCQLAFLSTTQAAPIADWGANPCVGSNCTPKTATKFNPGHYLLAGHNDPAAFNLIANKDHFVGAKVDYNWAQLETSEGVYDFSVIERDLEILKSMNKRMAIMVRYKTFSKHARNGSCAPQYLHDSGGVVVKADLTKCMAKLWLPEVMNRLIALYQALGAKYDKDPSIEALMAPETVIGLGDDTPADLNRDAWIGQMKRMMTAVKKSNAFPNTIFYQHMNFTLGGEDAIVELMDHAKIVGGIGVGSPDLAPNYVTWSTSRHPQYAGLIPLAIDNQDSHPLASYIKNGGTPSGAHFYATQDPNGLHANHIFWIKKEITNWSFINDIEPHVKAVYEDDLAQNSLTNIKYKRPKCIEPGSCTN